MKKLIAISAALALVVLCGAGIVWAREKNVYDFDQRYSANNSRACVFPDGGWTKVDCSNVAAATSGQLNAWSRYVVQCGDSSYIAWGSASDMTAADSSDGYIVGGAWLEYQTVGAEGRYFSCLNINSDSDCRYIECK